METVPAGFVVANAAQVSWPETPTPPVTTRVPVAVDVDAVPAVIVVAPLDANVVNEPAAFVVTPILVLLIVEAAVGLIVNAPTGEIATVPVPVGLIVTAAEAGDKVTVLEALNVVNAPVEGVVAPIAVLLIPLVAVSPANVTLDVVAIL